MKKAGVIRWIVVYVTFVLFVIPSLGCGPKTARMQPEENQKPSFVIEKPKQGETINGPNMEVKINVKNLELVPPSLSPKQGKGHIHFWLDSVRQVSYEPFFTFTGVTTGDHNIRVELVQSNHTSFDPPVEKSISVHVVGGAEPPP